MQKRQYDSAVHAARRMNAVLLAASAGAQERERIIIREAQLWLRRATDAMRIQACKRCNRYGQFGMAQCLHPDVEPAFNREGVR